MSVWGGGGESRRVGTTNTVPMAFRVKDASFLFNKGVVTVVMLAVLETATM